ncbi:MULTISPECIES: hypothetical protein [Halobacterium]|uniref:hypothetical protein n=1 Tax=Halobacterium TaxID=2239 RepID=UPI0019664377|nr:MULTISPECIES: hypothetical protein [Halobacterium]MCF2164707.1 hypothetical protein [Halobacterium salinarum]MCF2166847.1 hypothetical protein [Halobacterium salinarum]QRY22813.1 hypothetical protein JT689_01940 [Halobacterium sp. GSL-19]WJK64116.2 hypothetical protein QSJ49_02875 [Halobacterium salinarum]
MLEILLVYVIVNLIIATVVSFHAAKRGKSGYFWIVFFLGIIGVLLYVADMSGADTSERGANSAAYSGGSHETKSIREKGERDSLSAVYDELQAVGEADAEHFIEHVYPVYPAGYGSGEKWWQEFVSRELGSFSGVEPPTQHQVTWIHRPTVNQRRGSGSARSASTPDSWQTHPDAEFMHREIGSRARGLYVEVSDGDRTGKFFVDGTVRAESPQLKSDHGEDWVSEARSYLRSAY